MKIIQTLAKDLFFNKTEAPQPSTQGIPESMTAEAKAALGSSEPTDPLPGGVDSSKEAIDAETLEALTEERPLTPEEKKQVAQLMKDPQLTKQEKIEAISLMLRKRMPLNQAVMISVHEGLTTDLLSADLRGAIAKEANALDLMPKLLNALLKEISGVGQAFEGNLSTGEAILDGLFFDQLSEAAPEVTLTAEFTEDSNDTKTARGTSGKDEGLKGTGPSEMPGMRNSAHAADRKGIESEAGPTDNEKSNEVTLDQLREIESLLDAPQDRVQEGVLTAGLQTDPGQRPGKIFLRQEVTAAMKSAKMEFDQFKKTALDQLKSVENQPAAALQKQGIQKTIEAIDRVLMKSDIPLYTSMKMEKKLLVLSSSLSEVKKLVDQGKLIEAKAALKPIVEDLEAMAFKPSAKKMIYQSGLINSPLSQSLFASQNKGLDLSGALGKHITAFSEVKGSPRMVLEHLRGLGFNLEGEKQQEGKGQQALHILNKQKTIYQVLEALEQETDKPKGKQIEIEGSKELAQSLGNHRLVNKLEEGSPKQTLDLTIPYRTDQGVFELKVHVEARKQDELLDWENFKMFFVLETPKSGQIGIGIYTVDKKLSLTFKAENRRVISQLGPMVDELKRSLVGVGYQLSGIQYGLLSGGEVNKASQDQKEKPEETGSETKAIERKGVDFKV